MIGPSDGVLRGVAHPHTIGCTPQPGLGVILQLPSWRNLGDGRFLGPNQKPPSAPTISLGKLGFSAGV